jgi:molybdopterin molybdotransferase
MIALEEAQARLLALVAPLPIETVSLPEAIGRWSAETVLALRTQPARALSAMDGYAIAHADTPGPWTMVGESAAGSPYSGAVTPGQAVRIFTGAALPSGTDTIIIQEDVTASSRHISLSTEQGIAHGQHVRTKGSDFETGAPLIARGDRLTSARIALAAMGGHATLQVHRRATVGILSTGSELVAPGVEAGEDFLPESNSLMIGAMLRDFRCSVVSPGIIPDDLEVLTGAIRGAVQEADIIVTIGGASVGDHDLVRPALEACGAKIDFWRVAMRPGKPVMAGKLGDCIILGLPGNPVSAFVTAELFLKPVLASLGGANTTLPRRELAILHGTLPANGGRIDHVRAVRNLGLVRPIGINDSAALSALASADCLIVRAPNAPAAQNGETIEIIQIT